MENQILEKLRIPFLGTTKDGESFEYLLLSMGDLVEIAICSWFLQRVDLPIDAFVELHLPQYLTKEYRLRKNFSGRVLSVTDDELIQGKVYKLSASNLKNDHLAQFARNALENFTPLQLLQELIKDSMILKNGVRIYLKHLISYFSRLANYSRNEYLKLEETFLYDVVKRIQENENQLAKIHTVVQENIKKVDEVAVHINLEELREIFESEISLTLFNLIFSDEKKLRSTKKFPSEEVMSFSIYLRAIKTLEKRLYSNYNEIVLIYLDSLV